MSKGGDLRTVQRWTKEDREWKPNQAYATDAGRVHELPCVWPLLCKPHDVLELFDERCTKPGPLSS
jgi:hypothetical protein